DAAVAAARQWLFTPTLLRGEAVKVIGSLTFNFNLPDGDTNSGDSDSDIEEALRAVQANPNSAEAHFALGEAYKDEAQDDKAVEEFEKAIELKRDYEQAYLTLAQIYYEKELYDSEISTLRRAVEAIPQSVDLLKKLGFALGDQERFAEGAETFKKV